MNFFTVKKLPKQIRWMVFKVKKQAAINYFDKTADSKDDDRFKFEFKVGVKAPEYSYNWPYDYCSLVELAQIEAEVGIGPVSQKSSKPINVPGLGNISPTAANRTVSVATGVERVDVVQGSTVPPAPKVNVYGRYVTAQQRNTTTTTVTTNPRFRGGRGGFR